MATIDGISFNLTGFDPVGYIKNTQAEPPGTDSNPNTDLGSGKMVVSLSGLETSRTTYDTVINAFMSEGVHELVLDTGWKYYVQRGPYRTNRRIAPTQNWFPYTISLVLEENYIYSTTTITRTKTISSDGQTWSADDSSNSITTAGNVPAKPTIVLTAGAGSGYGIEGDETEYQDDSNPTVDSTSYTLAYTHTFSAKPGKAWRLDEIYFEADTSDVVNRIVYYKVTATATSLNGGSETTVKEATFNANTNDPNVTVTYDSSGDGIQAGNNEDLVVKYYFHDSASYTYIVRLYDSLSTATEMLLNVLDDVQVYNTVDTTVKCNICGLINPDTVVTINPNGTGTFVYSDDFSDNKSLYHSFAYSVVTFDTDHISIADDGYIYYRIETYYPITGTPVLTATIDITAGTPTIQIAEDNSGAPGTFYDIDTAIVDNVSTEYELVSGSDVVLTGMTVFWVRIDCTATGTMTADVYALELDIDMITLDAQIPLVNTGGANTFQCDQLGTSSQSCTISIQYEDRKWA